jgi:FkbM family methyltransferase
MRAESTSARWSSVSPSVAPLAERSSDLQLVRRNSRRSRKRGRRASPRVSPQVPYIGETTVLVITLDQLIAKYGRPVFCKIDVEGYDAEVVAGLSEPITALSCEFAIEALDVALRAMSLLSELGDYRFAYSLGRSMTLSSWMDFVEAEAALRRLAGMAWGDVYARVVTQPP